MKHHLSGRPIGMCKGCCLNLRTMCAAGLEPRAEWDRGRCRSRDDQSLLETFYSPTQVTGAKATKLLRRARAVAAATRRHINGRVRPGRYVSSASVRV